MPKTKVAKEPLKEYQVSVDAGAYIVVKASGKDDAIERVGRMSQKTILEYLDNNIEIGSVVDCLEDEDEDEGE